MKDAEIMSVPLPLRPGDVAGVSVEQVDIGVCRIVDGPDVALDLNNLKHTASLYFLPLVGDLIGSWGRPIQAEPFVTALNFCKEGGRNRLEMCATTQNCERRRWA